MNALPIQGGEALRRAHAIGQYYGFRPFSTLASAKRGGPKPAAIPQSALPQALDPVAESVTSFLRSARDAGIAPNSREPMFLWHSNIAAGRPAPKHATFQFHALGADRAIADAVIIRSLSALAADLYKSEPEIRLNSMGDKETRARFARELGLFFKRRTAQLSEECTACAKRDVLEAAELLIKQECAEDLPSPIDHLSDQSRKRFEELLEYMEATETPYTLTPDLISRGAVWSETCFEIRIEGQVVAWGSRYGDLAKTFFGSSMPAVGGVLKIATAGEKVAPAKNPHRIRFAFVHIGAEAKHASIKLAEELKRARLPLAQMVGLESLGEQMRFADSLNPPYLLIMGRKEALEHSAILRNRSTQEETVIPLSLLAERLKTFA